MVWQDNRNGNWDIYLYDGMTGPTSRLTDDPKDQKYPQIAGRYVVWEDYRNSQPQNENPDIYLLDLDDGRRGDGEFRRTHLSAGTIAPGDLETTTASWS